MTGNPPMLPADRHAVRMLIDHADAEILRGLAIRAAYACGGGGWSVDFAQDRAGAWWLIDMAVAADSWHWPGCEAR